MLSPEIIKQIAPKARADYITALVEGSDVMLAAGINTPLRMAAFLATICHETGGLTIVRENTAWTKANLAIFSKSTAAKILPFVGNKVKSANAAYGFRMGNEENGTNDDDGWRYRGGGLIQLTGRDSYRAAGLAIGVNLESQPELIEDAAISLRAAIWEFTKFLTYCDKGEKGFRGVCNGINRGKPLSTLDPIGWSDRQIWYRRCCDALATTSVADTDVLNMGDQGAIVKAFQERLGALGYAIGRPDGVFGSRTRAAVLAFQAENGLLTDGDIGPLTRAALNSETAVAMPIGERAVETIADLREKGSETVLTADKIKAAGLAAVALGGGSGAVQQSGAALPTPDILPFADGTLKELTLLRTITNGFADVFAWAASHWWLLLIVGGFFAWKWGRDIQWRRLLEHNLGLNLSK